MARAPSIDGMSVSFTTAFKKIVEFRNVFGSFHLKREFSSLESRPQFEV